MTESDVLAAVEADLWARDSFSFIPDRTWPMPPDGPQAGNGTGPRVLFVGLPSDYSVAFLLALLRLPVQVVGIVTSPLCHPAVAAQNIFDTIGACAGVPVLRPARVNSAEGRQALAALDPDAAVMASFDQIVRADALAIPRHGWLNLHPSLLPAYRGPEPVYWAVAEAAPTAGITAHRAVPVFDAGPILAQRSAPVHPVDTSGTLARRLTEAGAAMLGDAVEALLRGDEGRVFDVDPSMYRPSVGHRLLSAAPTAVEAERLVRAGNPDLPAWTPGVAGPSYVLAARIVASGEGSLRFPDGDLLVEAASAHCRCVPALGPCDRQEGVG